MSSASSRLSPAPAADAPQPGADGAAETPAVEMSDAPAAEAEGAEGEAMAEAGDEQAAGTSSKKGAAAELRTPAFALARVGRIIKADADIDTLPKESLRAIALAAEMVVATLASTCAVTAQTYKRKYVQYSDMSAAVQKLDLAFLQPLIPPALPLPVAIRRRERYIQKLKEAQEGEGNAAELLEAIKKIPIWNGGEVEGEIEPWE